MPVMTRRSTVDWVLSRVAATEPRVEVRHGVKVTGLLAIAGLVAIRGACTREALGRHGGGPPVAQPTREQLAAVLSR